LGLNLKKTLRLPPFVLLLFATCVSLCAQTTEPTTAPPPTARWINVTAGLGGDKWGFGGLTAMAAVPGTDMIIAGVSETGLWASSDAGKTWIRLGAKDTTPISNHPYQILFDPKNPRTFWETGNSGPGVFRTDDGGESFHRLGNIDNVDGIGIDFTDEQRKTIVVGIHDQPRSVQRSSDGGQTWKLIGDKLPANTNISNNVLVFDANNYVVNAAGWKRDGTQVGAQLLAYGTFRTQDGGASFAKVSDSGPSGPALVASDGAIYWQTLWNNGLIKSTDQGKTWQQLPGAVKVNPIELPGGKLVAAIDSQLHVSADRGKTWEKFGEPVPFEPSGLTYCAKTRSLYAWRSTDGKEESVVVRWEIP
jgi:photosystem II stability/assembly factor-like uncharacterized protein